MIEEEKKNIEKGNELIARFMGYIYKYEATEDFSDIGGLYSDVVYHSKEPISFEFMHEDGRGEGAIKKVGEDCITIVTGGYGMYDYDNSLKYHESWDKLMPVVKQCCKEISELGFDKRGSWTPEHGYPSEIYIMQLNSPIEKVWTAVVKYIVKKNKKNDARGN